MGRTAKPEIDTVPVVLFMDCETFEPVANCSIVEMPAETYRKWSEDELEARHAVRECVGGIDLADALQRLTKAADGLGRAALIMHALLSAKDRRDLDAVRSRAWEWIHGPVELPPRR